MEDGVIGKRNVQSYKTNVRDVRVEGGGDLELAGGKYAGMESFPLQLLLCPAALYCRAKSCLPWGRMQHCFIGRAGL